MEIVFLDSKTLGDNFGFEGIKELGQLTLYSTTSCEQIPERIKNADIIITNKVKIGTYELDCAKNLKLICIAATGYDNINIKEAKKRNIKVANVKNYSTNSVSQMVFAGVLTLYTNLQKYDRDVKNNLWSKSQIFTMLDYPIYELSGKTIGIIGYGKIGKKVSEIAKAFGMIVKIMKRENTSYNDGIQRVSLDEILCESDIISLHIPLTEHTKGFISGNELKKMKKNAVIVNLARGGIINENDLYEILNKKKIYGAVVDVMSKEPPDMDEKLIKLSNIIITPHNAWASTESRQRLMRGMCDNIRAYIEKKEIPGEIN